MALVPCELGCGATVPRRELLDHQLYSCNLRQDNCPECHARIAFKDMADHRKNKCVMALRRNELVASFKKRDEVSPWRRHSPPPPPPRARPRHSLGRDSADSLMPKTPTTPLSSPYLKHPLVRLDSRETVSRDVSRSPTRALSLVPSRPPLVAPFSRPPSRSCPRCAHARRCSLSPLPGFAPRDQWPMVHSPVPYL